MRSNKSLVVLSLTTAGVMFSAGIGFAAEKGVVTADSLNIRKGPGTGYSIVSKASKNTRVDILESKNGWYKVQLPNGTIGWGSGAYIDTVTTSTETKTGKITTATYLRESENWSSTKLELLNKGVTVEVISKGANWTKAKFNQKIGYIGNDYIEIVKSESNTTSNNTSNVGNGKITTATYLRESENWSSTKLELLNKGVTVEVISKGTNWTKARYNNKVGYIGNDYIEIAKTESSNTDSNNTSNVGNGKITTATYLRESENWSSTKLELLNKGVTVEVISKGTNWTKARYNNKVGYIGNDYIEIAKSESNNTDSNNSSSSVGKELKGTVNTSSLNVRSGPGTSYQIKSKVVLGQELIIKSEKNGWYEVITPNGLNGWVSKTYVDIIEDSQSSEELDERVNAVIKLAKAKLGKPYVWGAEGPDSFDCSGLMWYVYKNGAKISLPRSSKDQAKAGRAVSLSDIKPGDLVYFDSTKDGVVNHIGMYIGNSQWIHAPRTGDVVKIASTNDSYYKNNIKGARRIIG